MNMSLDKRRFVTGALIAITATALLACNRGGKEEQQPDPLGYYTAAEYSRFTSGIAPSYNPDPTTAVIENSIRAGSPIAIRVLMDKLFADHGQIYFGSRSYQTMPPRVAADRVWTALNEISGAIRYDGVHIPRLKQKFEMRLREFRRARQVGNSARPDSFSIASPLMENVGNPYSWSLAFDMFLRIHLGPSYPSDRMVMVFTDGEMRIAEIRNGHLYDFTDNGLGPEQPMGIQGPIRVVRTDDFLFVEAMRSQVSDPAVFINGASDKIVGRFEFSVANAGNCMMVPGLRSSIFAWKTGAQACVQRQLPVHGPHHATTPQVHGHVDPRVIQQMPPQPHVDPRMAPSTDPRYFQQNGIGVLPGRGRPGMRVDQQPPQTGEFHLGPREQLRGRPSPGGALEVPPLADGQE